MGALSGFRVIDCGEGVSAPYCARLFADYGAEVIKVEPSRRGDASRHMGPFKNDVPDPEAGGLFHHLNANKRSVRLDLDRAKDRERFLALVASADLLIENHTPAEWAALDLSPATLLEANPQLVLVSITPFGHTGPFASYRGSNLHAFHLSGASHRYCGRPGEAPLCHGTFSADYYGAVAGAAWGLAALLGRDNVGGGQHLDVSSAECIAASFTGAYNIGGYVQDGRSDARTGVGMPMCAPATIVPCKDGHVWMLAIEPGQWQGLARVMGDPEWMQPDIFLDMFVRAENADMIYPLVSEWAAQHEKMDIMDRCQAAGAPVTAVFTMAEAAEHPHLHARDFYARLDIPGVGVTQMPGRAFALRCEAGERCGPTWPAPRLGEADAELDALIAAHAPAPLAADAPRSRDRLPLEGLKVANFGWVWAGPVVGQTLGFLGAEVYKVESWARVDMTRALPPFGGDEAGPNNSLSNHACWAGNGSVSLNLKTGEGRALARELIAWADVVIENFGPGVMDGFGLGYAALAADHPALVYFSMPAAGLSGPLQSVRTYGLSLTSLTGLDSLVGYPDGAPIPVENAYSDPYGGIFGAFAVLAALCEVRRSGRGQHIDFSQQEAVMQMVGAAYMDYALNGRVAAPRGNRHPLDRAAPHAVLRCAGADDWIALSIWSDEEWRVLGRFMGDPEWALDTRFATLAGRLEHADEIERALEAFTRSRGHRALADALQAAGLCATPVLSIADLGEDPHFAERGTFVRVRHPLGFDETIYGAYVKTSATRPRITPGPVIGQDNEHVFLDLLGMDRARYDALRASRVIF